MIPPFSTLPSAAKIYSRVYAMFVPPARLGQFDVYRAAPGRSYQGNKKAGLKVCLAKVLLFILIFRPHPNPVPICRFNVISRDNSNGYWVFFIRFHNHPGDIFQDSFFQSFSVILFHVSLLFRHEKSPLPEQGA